MPQPHDVIPALRAVVPDTFAYFVRTCPFVYAMRVLLMSVAARWFLSQDGYFTAQWTRDHFYLAPWLCVLYLFTCFTVKWIMKDRVPFKLTMYDGACVAVLVRLPSPTVLCVFDVQATCVVEPGVVAVQHCRRFVHHSAAAGWLATGGV